MSPTMSVSQTQPRQLYSHVAQPRLYNDYNDPARRNTPEGPISIALTKSSRRTIHTANDLVQGVVHVKAKLQIERVTIKFVGKTSCRIRDSISPATHHHTEYRLFYYEQALSRKSTPSPTCPPWRTEYPFEFRFPETTQLHPDVQNVIPLGQDASFEHRMGHALPPSLWWEDSTIRNEYFLEADSFAQRSSSIPSSTVIQQLRFAPSVPEESLPVSTPPLSPSMILLERNCMFSGTGPSQERRGSLKKIKASLLGGEELEDVVFVPAESSQGRRGSLQKIKASLLGAEKFGQKTECVVYASTLNLCVPDQYRVERNSSIRISIETRESDGLPQTAPIYLRGIRAQAIAHLNYRLPTTSAPNGEIRKHGIEKFDLFSQRFSKPGLRIIDNTGLNDLKVLQIVPPTFRSYVVALNYDVKYNISVAYAGKESEHEVQVENVAIEPMTRPGGFLGPPEEPPPMDGDYEDDDILGSWLRPGQASAHELDLPPPYHP